MSYLRLRPWAINLGLQAGDACFDPGTLSVMALAGTAVGAGISAVGSLASGQAAEKAGQFSADASIASSQLASTAALNSSQLTAAGQEEAGTFTQASDEYQAKELTQNAATTRAEAQRQSFDIDQQTRLALSTLQANAGGSGLSSTGSTPLSVAGAIGARGSYLSLSNMAAGENTARGLEDEATAAHISGIAAKYGADLAAEGTIYSGKATSQADLYAGQTGATSAIMQGNATQNASLFNAAGTLASGFGKGASQYASIAYPTTARAS